VVFIHLSTVLTRKVDLSCRDYGMSHNSTLISLDGDNMSHTTKPSVRHAIIATTALSALLLAGCNPQHTSELSQSQKQLILEEIGLDSTLVGYPTQQLPVQDPAQGPSLIAGDWLAIQCAQANGYFNNWTPNPSQDPSIFAPVYASFLATDFE